MEPSEELEKSEAWQELATREEEKRKSLKSGMEVMHLNYFSGIILPEELLDYEGELDKVGLQFSSYDKNGELTASFDDLALITFLALSNTTVKSILEGTLTNASWDAVKYVTLRVWQKVKGKSYTKVQVGLSAEKPISFGIKAQLDKNTGYEFELSGDLSEKTVSESLDKILEFLKQQPHNPQYKFPFYTMYDTKTASWKATDVEAEIRKRVRKSTKKSRK